MQQPHHIVFHDDIDGMVTAAMVMRSIVKPGDSYKLIPASSAMRGKRFKELVAGLKKFPHESLIIVDYEYHPDADLWIDHHFDQSFGSSPVFNSKISYQPAALSAADVAAHCLVLPIDARGPELVNIFGLTNIIDSAEYKDVNQIFTDKQPLMALRAYVEKMIPHHMVYCRIVECIARFNFDVGLANCAMNIGENYVDEIRDDAKKIKDSMVISGPMSIVRVGRVHQFPRYSEYYVRPDIKYAVRLCKIDRDTVKVQMGFNKWMGEPNDINIGQAFRSMRLLVSGGGHHDVGGATIKEKDVEGFLDDLCVMFTKEEKMEKYAVDPTDPVEVRAQDMIKTGAESDLTKARENASNQETKNDVEDQ